MTVISQHHNYTGCTSPATTNAVTNRILLRKSDSCVYTRTSQIPHKFICSSRFTPDILLCHTMSYSSWDQPRVPAAPALPPTAEEEDEEDAAAMTGAQSDDSDSSAYKVEWERMEYIRTHRLPLDYLDDCTNEQLQGWDDELRQSRKAARRYSREIRELRERRREPPPEPPVMVKEPPPEPPVMFTAPVKEPPPQAPNKAPPPEAPAMLNEPPPEAPAMYKEPPPEVLAKLKAAPPVVPAMYKAPPPEALAMRQAPPPPYQTDKARSRTAVVLWPKMCRQSRRWSR